MPLQAGRTVQMVAIRAKELDLRLFGADATAGRARLRGIYVQTRGLGLRRGRNEKPLAALRALGRAADVRFRAVDLMAVWAEKTNDHLSRLGSWRTASKWHTRLCGLPASVDTNSIVARRQLSNLTQPISLTSLPPVGNYGCLRACGSRPSQTAGRAGADGGGTRWPATRGSPKAARGAARPIGWCVVQAVGGCFSA